MRVLLLCVLALASVAVVLGAPASCAEYCEIVTVGANDTAPACPGMYPQIGTFQETFVCEQICALWQLGGDVGTTVSGDNVACRQHFASLVATAANPQEAMAYCAFASPVGGFTGNYVCGDIYNFYCDVVMAGLVPTALLGANYKCKSAGYASNAECANDARKNFVSNNVPLNLSAPVTSGDDVECRLSYGAIALDPSSNGSMICPQAYWAGYNAAFGTEQNCVNESLAVADTSCNAFCLSYQRTCNFGALSLAEDESAYMDFDDCMDACDGFDPSVAFRVNNADVTSAASKKNTVGCRRYQLVRAANDATTAGKQMYCTYAAAISTECSAAFGIAPVLGLVVALIALVMF